MPIRDNDETRKAYYREYNKGWYQRHRESGESHPACLHFHHRDRSDKSFNMAHVVGRATSIKQILNEMKKCDILCANCHAIRHWREAHDFDDWLEVLPPVE